MINRTLKHRLDGRHGFTTIELLVVIGLIAVLSAIAVPSFASMQRATALNAVAQELADDLRRTRNHSLTAWQTCAHTVNFFTNRYELVCDTNIQSKSLPTGMTLAASSGTIAFERLTGASNCGTGCTVTVASTSGSPKSIEISGGGKITWQ